MFETVVEVSHEDALWLTHESRLAIRFFHRLADDLLYPIWVNITMGCDHEAYFWN